MSILGAAGSLLGSIYQTERGGKINRDLANESFWREANYNRPIEQVSRLKEAGLNPALALGGTGNTGGHQPTAPHVGNPVAEAIQNDIAMKRMTNENQVALATISNLRADTDLKNEQADNVYIDGIAKEMGLSTHQVNEQVSNIQSQVINFLRNAMSPSGHSAASQGYALGDAVGRRVRPDYNYQGRRSIR